MIRVLVVDDSATMRALIRATLRAEPDIEVVGEAGDAYAARDAIKKFDPSVITLDVEMPNMNGIDFLEKIMRLRPTPVVMVSSQTEAGTAATLRALEIGAVECVAKPTRSADGADAFERLAPAIRNAACARFSTLPPAARAEPAAREGGVRLASKSRQAVTPGFRSDGRLVAIGASTGGVEALIELVAKFPAGCPPTVITQHMPPSFTRSLAERLDRLSAASVSEATDGALLMAGQVYLAPGGLQHLTVTAGVTPRCRLQAGETVNGHRPSVDVLFNSVAKTWGGESVGVILTGMGRDGMLGLSRLREAGARTLGQDEATSVVYGMPKAAFEAGAVERQLPLHRIAAEVLTMTNANKESR